ncbi:MAG: N-acetylmuramoyl-L-alanine amidase, partial [Eubacteriaceae bacterium]
MKRFFRNKTFKSIILILFFMIATFSFITPKQIGAVGDLKVVVNPGHGGLSTSGGSDPGAVNSNTGIREVDLNNQLAIKTVKALRDTGINAILSHPIPGNPGLPTLLKTQPSMDSYSKSVSNEANKSGVDLLISIHHNSGGNASGYEFYWSSYRPNIDNDGIYPIFGLWSNPGDEPTLRDSTPQPVAINSKNLANKFNANFKSLGYVQSRERIVERDDAIVRLTNMTSVLIEAGFVSNDYESLQMANDSNQQKMAKKIADTVTEHFSYVAMTADLGVVEAVTAKDKFTVTAKNVKSSQGVAGISLGVTSTENGQTQWYSANKISDGNYECVIDTKLHNYATGKYIIEYYGKFANYDHCLLGTKEVTVVNDMKATSVEAQG